MIRADILFKKKTRKYLSKIILALRHSNNVYYYYSSNFYTNQVITYLYLLFLYA